jgi:hypothetical protein
MELEVPCKFDRGMSVQNDVMAFPKGQWLAIPVSRNAVFECCVFSICHWRYQALEFGIDLELGCDGCGSEESFAIWIISLVTVQPSSLMSKRIKENKLIILPFLSHWSW